MKVKFFCPRWGSEGMAWPDFFSRVKAAGFQGVEIGFPFTLSAEERREISGGLKTFDLQAIGQHWQTVEHDFSVHKRVFEQHLYSLGELEPLFINSQTGKDYYSFEQNLELFELADRVSQLTGVKVLHETHRGKWSFAAHLTKQYLEQVPSIRLTLDISHWFTVAESFLEDQSSAVNLAIAHADHLHARVGFTQGPQVMDPRAPENAVVLERHLECWDALVALKRAQQQEYFSITPEYGAPPYQHLFPYTGQPIVDQWEINTWMKNLLESRYNL